MTLEIDTDPVGWLFDIVFFGLLGCIAYIIGGTDGVAVMGLLYLLLQVLSLAVQYFGEQ